MAVPECKFILFTISGNNFTFFYETQRDGRDVFEDYQRAVTEGKSHFGLMDCNGAMASFVLADISTTLLVSAEAIALHTSAELAINELAQSKIVEKRGGNFPAQGHSSKH